MEMGGMRANTDTVIVLLVCQYYLNFVTGALLYRNIYSIKELQHNTGVN